MSRVRRMSKCPTLMYEYSNKINYVTISFDLLSNSSHLLELNIESTVETRRMINEKKLQRTSIMPYLSMTCHIIFLLKNVLFSQNLIYYKV